ncbi:unnamed protein product [Caenorhabditis sp. 36 PRJEB53466]|nr:unnamed protein product [Caenorhabditis sp. 36 PRJEB53466]
MYVFRLVFLIRLSSLQHKTIRNHKMFASLVVSSAGTSSPMPTSAQSEPKQPDTPRPKLSTQRKNSKTSSPPFIVQIPFSPANPLRTPVFIENGNQPIIFKILQISKSTDSRALTGDVDPSLSTVPKQIKTARTPTENEGNEPVADTSEVMEVNVDSKDPAGDQNKALVLFCGGRMEIEIYNPIKKALLGIGYLPFIRDDVKIDLAELLELADRDMIEFLKPREYANFYRQEILPAFANWQALEDKLLEKSGEEFEEQFLPELEIFPHQQLKYMLKLEKKLARSQNETYKTIAKYEALKDHAQTMETSCFDLIDSQKKMIKVLEERLSLEKTIQEVQNKFIKTHETESTLNEEIIKLRKREVENLTNTVGRLQQQNREHVETIGALRITNIELQTSLRAERRISERNARRFGRRRHIGSDDDTDREELYDLFGPPGRRYL